MNKREELKSNKDSNITLLNRFPKSTSTGTEYDIYVERILLDNARVVVNEKLYTILNYYDYNVPGNLLKKGSEFMAIAKLYSNGNEFCIRIKEILL